MNIYFVIKVLQITGIGDQFVHVCVYIYIYIYIQIQMFGVTYKALFFSMNIILN